MDKKRPFYAGEVWLGALEDFGEELDGHVVGAEADCLRMQCGRLERCLTRRIKAEVTGEGEWAALFYCYRWMTERESFPGYEEVRRLHGEEMKARVSCSAKEFCSPPVGSRGELLFRVQSVTWWMECQESFSLWLVHRDFRGGWRSSMEERARGVAAVYLSRLHKSGVVSRVFKGYGNKAWSDREWRNILRVAAGMVEKRYDCTEFEKWLWWAYPVARRYGWNTRELQDAAEKRGVIEAGLVYETNFRRRLMTMGLRLSGRKKARGSVPQVWDFAVRMVLPDLATMWGEAGGLLTERKR